MPCLVVTWSSPLPRAGQKQFLFEIHHGTTASESIAIDDGAFARAQCGKFFVEARPVADFLAVEDGEIVTPEGLPLAYEMLPGNTSEKTTLRSMIQLIQKRQG